MKNKNKALHIFQTSQGLENWGITEDTYRGGKEKKICKKTVWYTIKHIQTHDNRLATTWLWPSHLCPRKELLLDVIVLPLTGCNTIARLRLTTHHNSLYLTTARCQDSLSQSAEPKEVFSSERRSSICLHINVACAANLFCLKNV